MSAHAMRLPAITQRPAPRATLQLYAGLWLLTALGLLVALADSTLGSSKRPQPTLHLRHAERCCFSREHDITAGSKTDATGQTQTLHLRDNGLRAAADRDDEDLQQAPPFVLLEAGGVVGHHRQVRAGRKHLLPC